MNSSDTRSLSAKLSRKDRVALFLAYEGNKRLRNLGTVLYRLTGGRFTPHNRDRDVILLTTRGRKSGREHTVLLQSFQEGSNMIIVAANSGRSSHPDWLNNLKATSSARVESWDHSLQVRAEELSKEEAPPSGRASCKLRPAMPAAGRPPVAPSRSCGSSPSGQVKVRHRLRELGHYYSPKCLKSLEG